MFRCHTLTDATHCFTARSDRRRLSFILLTAPSSYVWLIRLISQHSAGCCCCCWGCWLRRLLAEMENSSVSSDVTKDIITSLSSLQSDNLWNFVFKVIYSIIGIVGIVDNLFVIIVFMWFIKITDKVFHNYAQVYRWSTEKHTILTRITFPPEW